MLSFHRSPRLGRMMDESGWGCIIVSFLGQIAELLPASPLVPAALYLDPSLCGAGNPKGYYVRRDRPHSSPLGTVVRIPSLRRRIQVRTGRGPNIISKGHYYLR